MKKSTRRSTILLLSLLLLVMVGVTSTVATADAQPAIAVPDAILNNTAPRTDLTYLEGRPGDTHLVYTFLQGGIQYKVVDEATEDFQKIHTVIYYLTATGEYAEAETQDVSIHTDGSYILIRKVGSAIIEKRTIAPEITYSGSRPRE